MVRGTWAMEGKRLAGKKSRSRRSVMGAAENDILQGIRNAQHATRPVGSVAKSDIFHLSVRKFIA